MMPRGICTKDLGGLAQTSQAVAATWKTDCTLMSIIIARLHWYDRKTSTLETSLLYQAQTWIGWQYIFDGWIT